VFGSSSDKHGQWMRRRRLDGSLNRVPIGFYSKIWMTLERCQGIQILNYTLNQSLTREMTTEEIKFALLVEEALNRIQAPEYRQLIVEASMLLTLLAQNEANFYVNEIICIDKIVEMANRIFLDDQIKYNGDAMLCCASLNNCSGACNICNMFYDLAPSGRYGSMNYIFRALSKLLRIQDCISS
jgi:phosphorylase kinase alpha/beta subunit